MSFLSRALQDRLDEFNGRPTLREQMRDAPSRADAFLVQVRNMKRSCVKRGLGDFASAFSMGLVGGFALHFLKTVYFSPPGMARWIEGLRMGFKNAPKTGFAFGLWGGIFSISECYLKRWRGGKKDALTSIVAGAFTGGVLAFRENSNGIMRGALIGGMLLGVIEGIIGVVTFFAKDDKDAEVVPVKLIDDDKKDDIAEAIYFYRMYRSMIEKGKDHIQGADKQRAFMEVSAEKNAERATAGAARIRDSINTLRQNGTPSTLPPPRIAQILNERPGYGTTASSAAFDVANDNAHRRALDQAREEHKDSLKLMGFTFGARPGTAHGDASKKERPDP